jgi:ATP-dependent RNA helicase SUPV3L1/SUV3
MLLCGFEKFDEFFVRIDILERLFVLIINSTSENKSEIKLTPEMLNLLGCSKDNFLKLIKKMNYKTYKKDDEIFFKYSPFKKETSNKPKNIVNDNPFEKLKEISFK